MAGAEDLFHASRRAGESKQIQIQNKSIPLNWFSHPSITPILRDQAPQMVPETLSALPYQKLEEATFKILSQQENITTTVNAIFSGQNPEINGINTMAIQMGSKAYILLCQVETTAGNGNFAIYVGRNANSSEFGHEAERDFHNLKNLSQAAEQKLSDKAKRKYKFLNPIGLMNPVEIDGNEYSSFTMPFIENYGELRARLYESRVKHIALPYLSYSVTFTKKMKEFNENAIKRNRRIEDIYNHLFRRFPDKPVEYVLKHLYQTEEVKGIKKQIEDLLIGNALIYLLSDGHFPKEFMINAGDWMVNFADGNLLLYLITIRGGWEKLSGDAEWAERMSNQDEVVPGQEMKGLFMPIFYDQDDIISTAIEKAKKLLKI